MCKTSRGTEEPILKTTHVTLEPLLSTVAVGNKTSDGVTTQNTTEQNRGQKRE